MRMLRSFDRIAVKSRIRLLIAAILIGGTVPTALLLMKENDEADLRALTTQFHLAFLAKTREIERQSVRARHNAHDLDHGAEPPNEAEVIREIRSAFHAIDQSFRSLGALYRDFQQAPPAVLARAEQQLLRIIRLQPDPSGWDNAASLRQTKALLPLLDSVRQLSRAQEARFEQTMRELERGDRQSRLYTKLALAVFVSVSILLIVWITRSIDQTLANQKTAQEALSVSKSRLSEAQRVAHVGNWDLTIATNALFWSDEACRIFGRNPMVFQPSYEAFVEAIHPDDRQKVVEAVEHAIANRQPYSIDHRIVLPSGEERIVHEEGRAAYGEDGAPTRLFGTTQDITDRRRAEETGDRFGRILDASLNEIYVIDAKSGKFRHVNEGALRNMGYTMAEMRELTPWDINKEVTEEAYHRIVEPLLDGSKDVVVFESVRLRKDGSSYPIEVHSQYFANENPPIVVSIVVEISERKKAEETAARFGRILEASLNEIFIFDAETCRFIDVNEGARRNLGYDLQELRGMVAWDIKSEISEEAFWAMLEPLRTGEKGAIKFETVHRRRDGTVYPVDVLLQLFSDEERPVLVAVTQDITDRKKAEENILELNRGLELSEARLSRAQQIAHIGNWEWNISRGNLYWSDEIYRIFGRDPNTFDASYDAFLGAIHPDDRQKVQDAVDRAVANRETYSVEHRLITADGEERFVHEQGEAEYDNDGTPVRMAGTVQDITDRKRAEETSARFGRVLDTSVNEFYVFDAGTLLIVHANETGIRST